MSLAAPSAARGESGNPFTDRPAQLDAAGTEVELRGPLSAWLTGLQRGFNVRLTHLIRALRNESSVGLWAAILGVAFLYGMIHALLPGHRKTLLFSYFLAQESRPVHGVIAGFSLGVLHAASASGIILLAYYVLRSGLQATYGDATAVINRATAWLVLGVGVLLLALKLREALTEGAHNHGERNAAARPKARHRSARALPLIILSGIVPCPGSALVMLFAVTLGIVHVGVAAVAAISLGMAAALSVLSVLTIVLRLNAARLIEGRFGHAAHVVLELGGAVFLIGFGLFLLLPGWSGS